VSQEFSVNLLSQVDFKIFRIKGLKLVHVPEPHMINLLYQTKYDKSIVMPRRRSPVRHEVSGYKRKDGTQVSSYQRGSGGRVLRPSKVVGGGSTKITDVQPMQLERDGPYFEDVVVRFTIDHNGKKHVVDVITDDYMDTWRVEDAKTEEESTLPPEIKKELISLVRIPAMIAVEEAEEVFDRTDHDTYDEVYNILSGVGAKYYPLKGRKL